MTASRLERKEEGEKERHLPAKSSMIPRIKKFPSKPTNPLSSHFLERKVERENSLNLNALALSTSAPTSIHFLPIEGTKKSFTVFFAQASPDKTKTSFASFA